MPFIHVKTTQPVSAETERTLKEALGAAIELIPGKTERWLMVQVEDNARMWFCGSNEPCAYAAVDVLGSASDEAYLNLTKRLTEILAQQLGVAPDRVYIPYSERSHWGWNGVNF